MKNTSESVKTETADNYVKKHAKFDVVREVDMPTKLVSKDVSELVSEFTKWCVEYAITKAFNIDFDMPKYERGIEYHCEIQDDKKKYLSAIKNELDPNQPGVAIDFWKAFFYFINHVFLSHDYRHISYSYVPDNLDTCFKNAIMIANKFVKTYENSKIEYVITDKRRGCPLDDQDLYFVVNKTVHVFISESDDTYYLRCKITEAYINNYINDEKIDQIIVLDPLNGTIATMDTNKRTKLELDPIYFDLESVIESIIKKKQKNLKEISEYAASAGIQFQSKTLFEKPLFKNWLGAITNTYLEKCKELGITIK